MSPSNITHEPPILGYCRQPKCTVPVNPAVTKRLAGFVRALSTPAPKFNHRFFSFKRASDISIPCLIIAGPDRKSAHPNQKRRNQLEFIITKGSQMCEATVTDQSLFVSLRVFACLPCISLYITILSPLCIAIQSLYCLPCMSL